MNIYRRSESFIRLFLLHISPENVFRIVSAIFDGYACVKSLIFRAQNCSKSNRHSAVTRLHEQIFWHGTAFTRAEIGTGKISGTGAVLFLGTLCLHVEN